MMPLNAFAAKTDEGGHPFTDVPAKSWYAEAVQYVYENGIFSGTGPTTFTPDGTMTRGMFVTVLFTHPDKTANSTSTIVED